MATNYSLRGHEGKIRYSSRSQAKKAARRTRLRNGDGVPMAAYKCGLCDGYHVGRNEQNPISVLIEYLPNREYVF